jgi:hypothetical protein
MKYGFLIASVFVALTGPMAQAMPIVYGFNDIRPMLVRDGCGPDSFLGRDGYCHRDRRDWGDDWRWSHRPPPRDDNDWRRGPRRCPPGFHVGRYSGVCKPNEGF